MFPLLTLIILLTTAIITSSSDCRIDPLRIRPTPLIIDKKGQIIYSNPRSQTATLSGSDEILLACPGNQLLRNNVPMGESIAARCVEGSDGNLIIAGGQDIIDFYSLKCQDIIKDSVKYTQRACAEGGDEIEIGFNVSTAGVFVRQMRICFDNINLTPIFSHYNLTSSIGYRDGKVPRSRFFEEDGFYSTSKSLDDLYRRDNERASINEQLELNNASSDTTYIKQKGEIFINRGHLSAKGDFVYAFQQLATFHYVNSAPQWASFNGGNWNELEISLRAYAASLHSLARLEVYTGVHGVSSLKNFRTNMKTPLFLHTIGGRYLLPIPQLFWKVIYNRASDQGIVVLGVNNAHKFDPMEDVICNDISDKVSWFNDKLRAQRHNNIEMGYVYACSIPDFRRIVGRCPVLNGSNLLL